MCKVNPKIDLVFKKLFGDDQNKDLLLSLINSMLAEGDKMKDVTIKNPYNIPDYLSGKLSVLDIKAVDEKGRRYNVEMQIIGHDDYGQRTLFYWAQAFTEQIGAGSQYSGLNKTIVINLVDFEFFEEDESVKDEDKRYHREVVLSDRKTNEIYKQLDYLSVHFVELKKFDEDKHGIKNTLDRWITFLNRAGEFNEDDIPEEIATEEIKKAVVQLNTMYLKEQEQEHYNRQRILLMDEHSRLETAKRKGLEEGKIEGIKEGKKEGIKEGIKEGKKEGEKESKNRIAKMMKENGESIDKIILYSGLTKEEIEKL